MSVRSESIFSNMCTMDIFLIGLLSGLSAGLALCGEIQESIIIIGVSIIAESIAKRVSKTVV